MNYLKFFFIFFILIGTSEAKILEDNVKTKITKNLRCLICQGQSVYDSDSEFANSVKLLVESKLNDGLSENQIYKFLVSKYGEWIVYDPKFNKNTYILWILPLLLFAFGGAIVFKKILLKK